MIIFTGLGLLVPLFYIGGIWLAGYVIDEILFHQTGYYAVHLWAQFVGMVVVGLLCYFIGRLLHRRTGKVMIEPATGKEVLVGGYHSFFFIPMHWWGYLFPALGIFLWIHDSWMMSAR